MPCGCPQFGDFAAHTLSAWPACTTYYLVDIWGKQVGGRVLLRWVLACWVLGWASTPFTQSLAHRRSMLTGQQCNYLKSPHQPTQTHTLAPTTTQTNAPPDHLPQENYDDLANVDDSEQEKRYQATRTKLEPWKDKVGDHGWGRLVGCRQRQWVGG